MDRFNKTEELGKYDTAINIIGSLKDVSVVFKAITAHFNSSDSVDKLINRRNEFNLRTEKSRKRIEASINKTFLSFINKDHEEFIQAIFHDAVPVKDQELFLLWHFALNNRLFREITTNVFQKIYYSGRVVISTNDITAYLKELLSKQDDVQPHWSEKTIKIIGTKYLAFMSKLNFLTLERAKSFQHIRPSSEALVIFLYFMKLLAPSTHNILANNLLPIGFVAQEDLQERLKKLSQKGLFNMNFNGVDLNIELIHSYKEICNVLYD